MSNNEITKVAQEDVLIVCLGNSWLRRNCGNKLKRRYYTSSRMRQAARLLIDLHKLDASEVKEVMMSYLKPSCFDIMAKAALLTASVCSDDEENLKSPSTAIKVGYDLKRMLNWYRNQEWKAGVDC